MLNAQRSTFKFQLTCRLLCRAKSRHLCSNLERFLDSARNARVIERWRLNSFMAGIVVKPRARILYGHDWVFSSEVVKVFGKRGDGDVISLRDGKDRLIGSAIYKSKSQIVARHFSRRRLFSTSSRLTCIEVTGNSTAIASRFIRRQACSR